MKDYTRNSKADVSAEVNQEAEQKRQHSEEVWRRYQAWREQQALDLLNAYREAIMGRKAVDAGTLDVLTPAQVTAVIWREELEEWLDTLLSGTAEAQMSIFQQRREVQQICDRILMQILKL